MKTAGSKFRAEPNGDGKCARTHREIERLFKSEKMQNS